MIYEELIASERQRYESLISEVQRKRRAWPAVSRRIDAIFADVKQTFDKKPFFDSLYIDRKTNTTVGVFDQTTNQNYISLAFGHHGVGIVRRKLDFTGRTIATEIEAERGGALQFSQGPSGDVVVMIYACDSKVKETEQKVVFYRLFCDPESIGDRDVFRAIRVFLWYSRATSFISLPSVGDVLWMTWYRFREWLHRLEWTAILMALAAFATIGSAIIAAYALYHQFFTKP